MLLALISIDLVAACAPSGAGPITHADIDRWAEAWNSHDVERVAALFTPDVAIDQPENTSPIGAARWFSSTRRTTVT